MNDVKIRDAELNDGDVITFGGPERTKIGQTVRQPLSEFIYKYVQGEVCIL